MQIQIVAAESLEGTNRKAAWLLLELCEAEFFPPLSQRRSPLQGEFVRESAVGQDFSSYFEEMAAQPCLLAWAGGAPAGFLSYRRAYQGPELGGRVPSDHVTTVCVAPAFRGRGIARALYQALQEGEGERAPFLSTRTWSTNRAQARLLEGLGWKEIVRLPDHRGPGVDTVYWGRRR